MKISINIITAFFIMTTLAVFGQGSGRSLDLNGSSSYASASSINLSSGAVSFMTWIKVDAFKTAHPYITSICGTEQGGNQAMFRLGDAGLAAEKLQFILQIGGSPRKLNGITSLTAGKWYHVAATYDGSTMKIYIDGVLDASMPQSGTISSNSLFEIGRNYGNVRILDGEIDELSVWKVGLSQSAIKDYMCQSINSLHPNYSSLEAYWKMDETSGSSLTDASGNNHTASFTGAPLRQNSSAPIGDASVHNYGSPAGIYMSHPDGDSLRATSITGNPAAVHMYRVDKKPNSTSMPSGVSSYDTTRYWGVHYVGGSNPRSSINYYHLDNSFYQGNTSCFVDLAKRNNNSATNWTAGAAAQSANNLALASQGPSEYILTFASNKKIHKDTSGGVCIGDSIQLTNSTTGFNYQWYKDGQVLTNDTLNTLKIGQAGKYFLTLSFNGCIDTSNSFSMSVGQKPTVSLSPFSSICDMPGFDTLKGGSPAGGVFINPYISGNLFVINSAGAGDHKIIYRYTAPNGCADTASQLLTVHPLPTVTLSPFDPVCEDSSAFTLSSGMPTGGTYTVNGSAGGSFDAKAVGTGSHSISYAFTDSKGCSNSASRNISVIALPTVVFSSRVKSICEGQPAFQLDGANPSGGLFSGTGVAGFNFAPTTAGVGNHEVTYNYTDRTTGCSNSAKDTIAVKAIPAAPSITQNGAILSATSADGYQWYDKNGKISNETNQTYEPNKSGLYRVSIVVAGCSSEISEAFDFDNSVGIHPVFSKEFVVFPNPTERLVNIKGVGLKSVKVFDLTGKELVTTEVSDAFSVELDVTELISGVYILEVHAVNGISVREVLIKK